MSKNGRPWMKFYPADWRADPNLRLCSMGARGLWIDLISLMHEGQPYGHLSINGREPTPKQVGQLCACSPGEAKRWTGELIDNGVMEAGEDYWYSRRMVRDKAKEEKDQLNGKGGGNPKLLEAVNGGVNPEDNGEDKAQKLEARVQKERDIKPESGQVPRARARGSNRSPEWIKGRWEQKVSTEVARLYPDNAGEIFDSYTRKDPEGIRVFNEVDRAMKAGKP